MLNLHPLECTIKDNDHIPDLLLIKYWGIISCKYSTVETITFEGEEAPELTGNPFPFKESILKIMVPSGKSEAYKAKWDSYESYHSKIEEKSWISHIKKITACTNSPGNSYTLLFFNTKHWLWYLLLLRVLLCGLILPLSLF